MPTAKTTTPKVSKPLGAQRPVRQPRVPRLVLKPPDDDPLEEWHQEQVFRVAELHKKTYPELAQLFHVPNGGYRRKSEAAALQRRGVKPGVPDIILLVARGGYTSLIIELKRFRNGQPTEEQKSWLINLAREGSKAVLARGWRAAWAEIQEYLSLPPTELAHRGSSPTTRKDTDF